MTETPQTPAKIYPAIIEAMGKIEAISKERRNKEQGYNFRGVDDAMNALNPVLSAAGIFPVFHDIETILFEPIKSKKDANGFHTVRRYTFRLYASDGSFVEIKTEGQSIDYGDKTITKAQSVAYREMLYKTFVAPFEKSEDIEEASHDLADFEDTQRDKLAGMLEDEIGSAETLEDLKTAFEHTKSSAKEIGQENLDRLTARVKDRKIEIEIERADEQAQADAQGDADMAAAQAEAEGVAAMEAAAADADR